MARQNRSRQTKGGATKTGAPPKGLRVIAGEHRGRRLLVPQGHDVRPTSDRARESLFNILSNGYRRMDGTSLLAGARVLDGFAGSGSLGIEALSRGADHVAFAEQDREALACLAQNLAAFPSQSLIIPGAIQNLPQAKHAADLILLDPPYAFDDLGTVFAVLKARGWLTLDSLTVLERGAKAGRDQGEADAVAVQTAGLQVVDRRDIGRNAFNFLRLQHR